MYLQSVMRGVLVETGPHEDRRQVRSGVTTRSWWPPDDTVDPVTRQLRSTTDEWPVV